MLWDAGGRVVGGAEIFRDLSEIEALRRELEGRARIGELVGRSLLMQRAFEVLPAVAALAAMSVICIIGFDGVST